jgi:signal transduction histidine kinase/CheY-like chemotaxis protein
LYRGRAHIVTFLSFCFLILSNSAALYSQSKASELAFNNLWHRVQELKHEDHLEEALITLNEAANLAEELGRKKLLVDCHNFFAELYIMLDKTEMAEFSAARTDRILQGIEYPNGHAVRNFIASKILFRDANYFQALNQLNKARNQSNNRNLLNRMTLFEGTIYEKISKFDKAETLYKSILVNQDPVEPIYLKTLALLGLAQLELKNKGWETGIYYADSARSLAYSNRYTREIKRSNQLLKSLHELAGNSEESLKYLEANKRLQDSVYNLSRTAAESAASDQVALSQMSKTITLLEGENNTLKKSADRSELTAILTSAFLTIISLLALSLYRNNQIKLKTNDLLHTKNRELQGARDAAVQAMEAKTNFLSTVSHELRTPLYAVTGLTHLLIEENPSEAQLEHLKALKFSGDYLLNFINDILQINKIDADKLEPLEIEFKLKKVIAEVLNSLQQTAREQETKLILDYDSNIPVNLMSDPLKLSQIFINLVGNALKFTKYGEVYVRAKMGKQDRDRVTVQFEIQDTGIGIAREMQEKIFDSFEQGSIQINREYGGTGLGLSIVKSLLGLFGSKIQLKSELGKGSTFFFELQFTSKNGVLEENPTEFTQTDFDYTGLHLLVVEDNKINQVITRKMLGKKEITCDVASNGTEAVAMAKENEYDGILMDIHMPGISGVEATEQIRLFDTETPIIALTAISLDDRLETFFAAGCNEVVTKPFKPEVFYRKIGEYIVTHKYSKNAI